ncbi:amino acid adenylation domain-containing protein [Rhodocaloribacter sp.]
MADPSLLTIPESQRAVRARCAHPSGVFTPFAEADVEQSLPARFEAQARRFPERLAVRERGRTLTYAALDRRANRIAHALLTARGDANEPVALFLDNGAAMIAAVLGALKAGKIFVPLDPTYPPARTAYMLADAEARVLLTDRRNRLQALALADADTVVLDVTRLDRETPDHDPALPLSPDTLAYILYTSGSTGRPKGVVQTHRGQLHDARNWTNGARICPDDRLMLPTAYTQLGVQLFSAALLNGASLFPFDVKREGMSGLAQWLRRERITVFRTTATLFRHFARTLSGDETFPHLRLIRLGGEPVFRRDWEAYRKHFGPHCLLYNALATTETGAITEYLLDHETAFEGSRVPVGYPVAGAEVLLLGEDGAEVPPGEVGEIVVRSRFHAPGYWRRPGVTAEKYRDGGDGATRLYHTGDLGRKTPDGCLMHLGRKDFQVKIRGFRIEPAEVERALARVGNVKDAVVTAWTDEATGEARLVAYVVPHARPAPTASTFREALAETLPDHMIPAAYVVLDALPQTPNGKTDRRALPAPGRARPDLGAPYAPPRSPAEAALAEIWAETLGLDRVGIHDRFLDLGGDSLRAIEILSRVLNAFHVELPLRSLFDAPTVAEMAAMLGRRRAPEDGGGLEARTNLTRNQLLLWVGQKLHTDTPLYHTAVTFTLEGAVDPERFRRAFASLAAASDTLRTVIREVDGVPRREVLPALPFEMPLVDLTGERDPEAACRAWTAERCRRPFGLAARLFDAALLKLAEERFVFYLNQHQLICDAVSCAVLLRRLDEAYARAADGTPELELPPFEAYAAYERADRASPRYRAAEAHWERVLAEDLPPIPFFGKPVEKRTTRIRRVTHTLDAERAERLRAFAAAQKGLPGLWTFGAFAALLFGCLHHLSGARRLALGAPVHNRPGRRFRETLGLFMEVLPVRATVTADDTFRSLMEKAVDAYAEGLKHTPYAVAKKAYEVVLNYNPPLFPDTFGGVPMTFERVHTGHELDSLALHVYDGGAGRAMTLHFEFHTDVFTEAEGDRTVAHFFEMTAAMLADPERAVGSAEAFVPAVRPGFERGDGAVHAKRTEPSVAVHGGAATERPPYEPPRTEVERALAAVWQAVLGVERVGRRDDFLALGGDAMRAVEVAARARRAGLDVTPRRLFEHPVLADLAVREEVAAVPTWPSLVAVQPHGAKPPLFCVPPHGGTNLVFTDLARCLGPDQPVYGLEPVGLRGEAAPHARVEAMAAHYLSEIRALQPEGPYHLCGKCFGGIVAFEMAQQLHARGETVALLALFDVMRPPNVAPPKRAEPASRTAAYYARRFFVRLRSGELAEVVRKRLKKRWRRVDQWWRHHRKNPHLHTVRSAHREARHRYVAEPYPGAVVVFRAAEAGMQGAERARRRWERLAEGGVTVHVTPGGHRSMMRPPHVETLAERLRPYLDARALR